MFFYCFFVAIQSGIVTFIVERDLSAWSLKPTLRLLAVVYSVNSCFVFTNQIAHFIRV